MDRSQARAAEWANTTGDFSSAFSGMALGFVRWMAAGHFLLGLVCAAVGLLLIERRPVVACTVCGAAAPGTPATTKTKYLTHS